MNKPTLALLSAIAIIGLTTYWFISQKIQSPSQDISSIAQQENEHKTSSYHNPMNAVTTSSIPTTDSVKLEIINIGEELATPNQILVDSESKDHESTAKLLKTLKLNETNVELELDKPSTNNKNTPFSISSPEAENTMRITPNKNNSTMDVKK